MALIIAVAWLYVSARLVTYERGEATFKFGKSLSAYLLIVGSFARAVEILVNWSPTYWPEAFVSLALAFLAYRAKGNVSKLLKVHL